MASPERVDWKRRVDEHVSDPTALDGMRNAFRTTLNRQAENLPRMRGLDTRRERAKVARKESAEGILLDEAIANLKANHVRVVGPCSKLEAQEAVLRELGEERLVVKSKSNVTKEIELTKSLEEKGIVVVETDAGDRIIQIAHRKQAHPTGPAVDLTRYEVADILAKHFGRDMQSDPEVLTKVIRQDVRSYIDSSKIGITGANYITAEEGAVVIIHNEGNAAECA
ncbi:MAG: LUD domain-containing protein, partial [Methanomassiliicoccales archaeon]|nr:LUD domain-containing protein [Methanomassiliicoccales archaeon]